MTTEFDIAAFVAQDYPRVVAAVRLVAGSTTDAEDLVQDALARAWERHLDVNQLAGWVTVVACNAASQGRDRLPPQPPPSLRSAGAWRRRGVAHRRGRGRRGAGAGPGRPSGVDGDRRLTLPGTTGPSGLGVRRRRAFGSSRRGAVVSGLGVTLADVRPHCGCADDRVRQVATVSPTWWEDRRYGLHITSSIAAAPAFAPLHGDGTWYWASAGLDRLPDVPEHRVDMPEVIEHHRERHGDVRRFDDFIGMLRVDAAAVDAWADLAQRAGARRIVHTTKHHDGFCWFDTSTTTRRSSELHGGIDVVAHLRDACERRDLTFGTAYSMIDWADPNYGDPDRYASKVLHRHVMNLVETYRSALLVGDGRWAAMRSRWRLDELVERVRTAAAALEIEVMVDDAWSDEPDVATLHRMPVGTPRGRWQLCLPIGTGWGANDVEQAPDVLAAPAIVSTLSETISRGGHLLVGVGPAADGSVPEHVRRPLLDAGAWIAEHHELVRRATPWEAGGDQHVRFVQLDDEVCVIDVGRRDRAVFPMESHVRSIATWRGETVEWAQRNGTVDVLRPRSLAESLAPVYRVTLQPVSEPPARLLPRHDAAELFDGAESGDVVVLDVGAWVGSLAVPPWVTVQGDTDASLTGAISLAAGSAVQNLRIVGTVESTADDVAVRGCQISGDVRLDGSRRAVVTGNRVTDGSITLRTCAQGQVIGNEVVRAPSWDGSDVAIEIARGADHRVEGNHVDGPTHGIRLRAASQSIVGSNDIRARAIGIHVEHAGAVAAEGNRIEGTTRAVCVTGGSDVAIVQNHVERCDSGVMVHGDATGTVIQGNELHDCRVGIFLWGHQRTQLLANTVASTREVDVIDVAVP
jgi:alpha-L-fucosidase